MSHIINWIKFKIQRILGIYELIEQVDILEQECINLSNRVGTSTGDMLSNRDDINNLLKTTSELRVLIEQIDIAYHLGSKDQQWKKEEEIDFIQKSYE